MLGKLAIWRRSFEKLNREYETITKKRQALSSLLNSGRISQFTFDLFDKEMDEALAEIEKQKETLLNKMVVKTKEVEEQIRILERLLANYEIQRVGGEIEDEVYQREITLLSMGLENARKELDVIKEVMDKLAKTPQTTESISVPCNTEPEDVVNVEAETLEIKKEAEAQVFAMNSQETLPVETKTEG